MVEGDQPLAVLQVFVGGLHHIVRHGRAHLTGKRVDAPPRVVADAQKRRRLHLPVHRGFSGGLRVAVLVVEGAGAAVLEQIRHRGKAGIVDDVGIHQLEDAVDLVQPLHHQHVGVVDGDEVAHKGLEEVVMCVDKAGIHELSGGVERLRPVGWKILADGGDPAAFDQHVLITVYRVRLIAGDDRRGVFDQQSLLHETLRTKHPNFGLLFAFIVNHIATIRSSGLQKNNRPAPMIES